MPIAYWRDEYRTGHAQVDEQHMMLFRIVNLLHDSMLRGEGRTVLMRTLNDLVTYTLEHFQVEERLMLALNYPDYEEHKARHEDLKAKVTVLLEKAQREDTFLTLEVSHFLTDWLIHHIKGSDQRMIKFLKEQSGSLVS
ncbi:MAG: bacteriohemerythrin [Leptolyngbyaceae cyanobacterium bins.59]|nr:bacteriohemerythrin [Leptolyngbyaceae cyanobacterium bins.59]